MTLYLLPPLDTTDKEVRELVRRAGAELVEAEFLHELWPFLQGGQIVVATLDATNFAVLNRNMHTLLKELPVAVMSAPGARYRSDWNIVAHALPTEDWLTLSNKLAKSGLLANDTKQAEARSKLDALQPDSFGQALRAQAAPAAPDLDEEVTDV